MYSDTQIFTHHSTTLGASLRRTSGVHCYSDSTSVFSFVGQKLNQCTPSSIRNAFTELFLLQHSFDVQIFVSDKIVFIHERFSGFVTKILTFVSNALMHKSYRLLVSMTFVFRKAPLSLSKSFLLLLEKSRLINLSTIRALDIGEESEIKSNYFTRAWKRLRAYYLTRKVHKPLTRRSSLNSTGFYSAFARSVKDSFNRAYFREICFSVMKFESRLRVRNRVVPSFSFESRESRIFSRFTASPKGFESEVYSDLSILKHLRVHVTQLRFLIFPFRKFISGVVERYRFLFNFPSVLSERKSFVVDPTSLFQDVIHLGSLEFSGV